MTTPDEEKKSEQTPVATNPQEEVSAEAGAVSEESMPTSMERLRAHYADRGEMDDEGLYGAAADEIGELRDWRSKREASDKELLSLLKSHQKIAQVLQYIAQGAPEIEALSRVFDAEDLIRFEGEPDFEQWTEGKKKREQDMKDAEDRQGQYDLNYQASLKMVEEFCAENGLDEESKNALLDSLFAVYDDLLDGKVSKETLLLFHKGITHDEDVADAEAQGIINGKNAKIDAKKKETIKSDSLPEIEGGGVTQPEQKPKQIQAPRYKSAKEKADELIAEARKKRGQ